MAGSLASMGRQGGKEGIGTKGQGQLELGVSEGLGVDRLECSSSIREPIELNGRIGLDWNPGGCELLTGSSWAGPFLCP